MLNSNPSCLIWAQWRPGESRQSWSAPRPRTRSVSLWASPAHFQPDVDRTWEKGTELMKKKIYAIRNPKKKREKTHMIKAKHKWRLVILIQEELKGKRKMILPLRDDQRHCCSSVGGPGVEIWEQDLGHKHLERRQDVLGVVHARGRLDDETGQLPQHFTAIIPGRKKKRFFYFEIENKCVKNQSIRVSAAS